MCSSDLFRVELERDLSPTLRAQLPDELAEIYVSSAKKLKARLAADGVAAEVPDTCPFTWDNVLGDGVDWIAASKVGD